MKLITVWQNGIKYEIPEIWIAGYTQSIHIGNTQTYYEGIYYEAIEVWIEQTKLAASFQSEN